MNENSSTDGSSTDRDDSSTGRFTRRRFVAGVSVVVASSLAGCGLFGGGGGGDGSDASGGGGGDGSDASGGGDGGGGTTDGGSGGTTGNPTDLANFRGSGPLVQARGQPGGTSITELPDLSGTLTLYLGGGEGGLYLDLIKRFKNVYPEFDVETRLEASASLANTIIEENKAGTSPADIFMAVDAGSLGSVAQAGAAVPLPSRVTSVVPSDLRSEKWVGFAGRARSVPYNTNALSESDLPDSVQKFPNTAALKDSMGWAPTYGAFQSFITAMRLLRGPEETKQWLNGMQEHGIARFNNEFFVSNAVADREILAGFANHYYALRVKNSRPNAPIDLHFTSGDAGALINVSGAEIIKGTDKKDLAVNFIRHLLSSEAQEFFATQTFAYPTVPGVPPAGGLPSIDELNPPDIDLTQLSEVNPTLELLRETDVL